MAFFRRKERPVRTPPPPPCPEGLKKAERAAEAAETTLREVESRDEEVTRRGEHLKKIHKVNRIGPKFWDAMNITKERRV